MGEWRRALPDERGERIASLSWIHPVASVDPRAAHVTTEEGRDFIGFLRTPGKCGIATFVGRGRDA